ncbi:NADAR [uncultured Caudovirales phage]|uniref:NADAR n=1 Tax=uncultured Caudovirales phage TaxID=2100421 RepID=A0A6J5LL30_9CAUD|nr:NADAR [uncultured Caudovirales phage]CAB4135244.1 NADAR [uncultured Caudovirales phage]
MAILNVFVQNQLSDPNAIQGFFGEYRWLSNFHLSPVEFEGKVYPSAENAFQAAKVLSTDRNKFVTCTPKEAKKFGRRVDMVYPAKYWNIIRTVVMYQVLKSKFKDDALWGQLKGTGLKYLEESNWWGDEFWGMYRRDLTDVLPPPKYGISATGQNTLGYLLMLVRAEPR